MIICILIVYGFVELWKVKHIVEQTFDTISGTKVNDIEVPVTNWMDLLSMVWMSKIGPIILKYPEEGEAPPLYTYTTR